MAKERNSCYAYNTQSVDALTSWDLRKIFFPNLESKHETSFSSISIRHTPVQIVHVAGIFMRIWSVYSMYWYLSQMGASVVLFIFCCLIPSTIIFLVLQKPWKGRPLANTQVVPSIINGGITALYFILWGKGVKSCGPSRAIMAEYSGAVLGVLSAVLYGRRGHLWKKESLSNFLISSLFSAIHHLFLFEVGGLLAMLASLYFLSLGWATNSHSSFVFSNNPEADSQAKQTPGLSEMVVPVLAGLLSAIRRVISRRVSLKNQLKKRLHAITISAATCFLFPVAMWDIIIGSTTSTSTELPFSAWAFTSTVLFGIILIFYVDNIAEERLHMVFSSPWHLMIASGCIILLEISYKMDFSLLGFLICSIFLGFGIYEATSLDHVRKDSLRNSNVMNGIFEDQSQMSSLPT